MDFGGNFRLLGKLDHEPWLEEMHRCTGWTQEAAKASPANRQASHLPLKGFDLQYGHVWPDMARFEGLLAELRELLVPLGPGYINNSNFSALPAGAKIRSHRDAGFVMLHSHRIHMCVQGNDRVFFTVGGETINMKLGEVWEINNSRVHAVDNQGDTDRIHFMVDWYPAMTQMQAVAYLLSENPFLYWGAEETT